MPRMRKTASSLKPTVAPGANPNSARSLGRIALTIDQLRRRGPASVRFGASPVIEVRVEGLENHRVKSKVELDGFEPTTAAILWTDHNGHISARVHPLGNLISKMRPRRVRYADFVLLNFFDTWDRTVHRAGAYEVILEPHKQTSSLIKKLRVESGFGITHAGRIVRADGRSMSLREARGVVNAVGWYLTFARGSHAHPHFIEAPSSASAQQVFRDWSMHRSDPWRDANSWFDPFWSLDIFDEALPGFVAAVETHGRPLRVAIDWYLHAQAADVTEAKIIFAVAAVEILATLVVAGSFAPAAVTAFDKSHRSAASKITELLTRMGGSSQVPPALRRLRSWAQSRQFDAPTAVTRLRNVVHANQLANQLDRAHAVRWEAAQLAFFWFEAAVLFVSGVPISRLMGRQAPVRGRWYRWAEARRRRSQ